MTTREQYVVVNFVVSLALAFALGLIVLSIAG